MKTMKRIGFLLLRVLVMCLGGIAVLWAHVCIRQGLLHQPSPGLSNFEGRECAHNKSSGGGCSGITPRSPEGVKNSTFVNGVLPVIAAPEYDCEQVKVVCSRANTRVVHLPQQLHADASAVAQSILPLHQEGARHLGCRRWCNTAWLLTLASVVVLML